jgi:hypothetical protein
MAADIMVFYPPVPAIIIPPPLLNTALTAHIDNLVVIMDHPFIRYVAEDVFFNTSNSINDAILSSTTLSL